MDPDPVFSRIWIRVTQKDRIRNRNTVFSMFTNVCVLQVCLQGVQDVNVQDGEGSAALHVATEGRLNSVMNQ